MPPPARGACAVRPKARRSARARPDEHPVGEGRRGRRRIRYGLASRVRGTRRDRGGASPYDRARGGDRGRDEHRGADPRSSRDEAVLDRAEGAVDDRPSYGERRCGDRAANRCMRRAGRRRRRRERGGVRPGRRGAREVRRRLAGGDSTQPRRLRGRARDLAGAVVIVYLVGMPGSGKSTVGPVLAGRLRVPFVELDAEVERAGGASVRDIFDGEGEARFRELEAAALVDVARRDPSVVSCGGGVVLEPANRVTLRATGEVVFLSVPLHVLRERVRPASDRPLIREEGDLERLFKEREPLYREFAAHVVDASGPVEEVAAAIRKELLRWSA